MTAPVLLLTTFAFLAPAPDPDEANKKDVAKFQGTWQVQKMTREGEDDTSDDVAKSPVDFDGDKFTIKHSGREEGGSFKLDAAKTPTTIDLVPSNAGPQMVTILGIYKLDGDTLTIAFGLDGTARPTEFVSKPKSKVGLLILKRDKK